MLLLCDCIHFAISGMLVGIPDYDDLEMQDWTEHHLKQDFTPFNYLQNVSKHFLFAPGNGTMYSSNGYVVMGLVLAAVTNSTGWQSLNQYATAGLGHVLPPLKHTRFMETGPCSQYPDVVHQYAIKASAQRGRRWQEPRMSTSLRSIFQQLDGVQEDCKMQRGKASGGPKRVDVSMWYREGKTGLVLGNRAMPSRSH